MSGQAPYARDGEHYCPEISGRPDRLLPAGPASPLAGAARPFAGLAGESAGSAVSSADAGASAGTASFAGRAVDYGGFRPVPDLIEEQADRHPARVAACYAGRTLTYRQLDQLANG